MTISTAMIDRVENEDISNLSQYIITQFLSLSISFGLLLGGKSCLGNLLFKKIDNFMLKLNDLPNEFSFTRYFLFLSFIRLNLATLDLCI